LSFRKREREKKAPYLPASLPLKTVRIINPEPLIETEKEARKKLVDTKAKQRICKSKDRVETKLTDLIQLHRIILRSGRAQQLLRGSAVGTI
jgi:hypothetical protein